MKNFIGFFILVFSQCLVASPGDMLEVSSSSPRVNLREFPTTKSRVISQVIKGQHLVEKERADDWVRIDTINGQPGGWIYAPLVKPLQRVSTTQPVAAGRQEIALTGMNNARAVTDLVDFLNSHAISAEKLSDETVMVSYKNMVTLFSPRLSHAGLDRLLIVQQFFIRDEYKKSKQVQSVVEAVNRKIETGRVGLSAAGDMLIYQGTLTFVDDISLTVLTAYLDYLAQDFRSELAKVENATVVLR